MLMSQHPNQEGGMKKGAKFSGMIILVTQQL